MKVTSTVFRGEETERFPTHPTKSEVTRVFELEGIFLEISFECGNVDAFIENIVTVKRPPNIVKKFEWCYMLKNEDAECVGYIGKIEKII